MDEARFGRVVRALRRRRRWRQCDLADAAGVSQQLVSQIERGAAASTSLRILQEVLRALEAGLELDVRWRGGEVERLIDERHAALVAAAIELLRGHGWEVVPEVTYARYGERGSIDVLGWRADARALVIVEVKSELLSLEAMLRRHDEKARLAPMIARDRNGWDPRCAVRLLVLPETRTARRQVERRDDILRIAYPVRGWAARAWLSEPVAARALLLFLSPTAGRSGRRTLTGQRRVRLGAHRSPHAPTPPAAAAPVARTAATTTGGGA